MQLLYKLKVALNSRLCLIYFLFIMETKTTKELIFEYVHEHYKHFNFYPIDVEVNNIVYSYNEYWKILDQD